ncbi:MAG: hypothetical protein ACR2PR_04780 [Pseudohongiellaceae bacterium]
MHEKNSSASFTKPILKSLLMLLTAGAGVLAYILFFILKRQVAPNTNVLAESLLVFITVAPLVIISLVLLHKKRIFTMEATIAAGTIFILAAGLFHFTVPAIVDRSVTLYLMNLLDNNEQGMSREDIRAEFIEVYFNRSRGIEKRLNEQLDSGNIVYDNDTGTYHITSKGRRTMALARVLSKLHSLDPQIVEKL